MTCWVITGKWKKKDLVVLVVNNKQKIFVE